jgi:hypothetical protein
MWLMVTPHSEISRGAVTAKELMSANSKKYANERATRVTLWKREIGSLSSRFAAFECMSTPLSGGTCMCGQTVLLGRPSPGQ